MKTDCFSGHEESGTDRSGREGFFCKTGNDGGNGISFGLSAKNFIYGGE